MRCDLSRHSESSSPLERGNTGNLTLTLIEITSAIIVDRWCESLTKGGVDWNLTRAILACTVHGTEELGTLKRRMWRSVYFETRQNATPRTQKCIWWRPNHSWEHGRLPTNLVSRTVHRVKISCGLIISQVLCGSFQGLLWDSPNLIAFASSSQPSCQSIWWIRPQFGVDLSQRGELYFRPFGISTILNLLGWKRGPSRSRRWSTGVSRNAAGWWNASSTNGWSATWDGKLNRMPSQYVQYISAPRPSYDLLRKYVMQRLTFITRFPT